MSLAFSAAASYKRMMLLPAAVGAGLLVFGFLINSQQFYTSYLQGYLFALAFPVGCLGLTCVHNLSGGKWGWTIRPFLEAGIQTLPAMVILFIPIAVGMGKIYPWMNQELVAHDAILQAKQVYLNQTFWLQRAAFYLISWVVLGWWMRRWLLPAPEGDIAKQHRGQRLRAGGLLFLVLSFTFAIIDWSMSVSPYYFSSIFGVIYLVGAAMSAFSCAAISLVWFNRHAPNPWLTPKNFHDIGKFMFMTVMLWGYMSLSQFLIIWSGNLPEETFWYFERSTGAWPIFSTILPFMQFVIPFFLLLAAKSKKNTNYVVKVAFFLLVGRALEQIWYIAPSARPGTFPIHWMDIAAPIALGATWAALYFAYLGRSSGVPAPAAVVEGPQDQQHGGGNH